MISSNKLGKLLGDARVEGNLSKAFDAVCSNYDSFGQFEHHARYVEGEFGPLEFFWPRVDLLRLGEEQIAEMYFEHLWNNHGPFAADQCDVLDFVGTDDRLLQVSKTLARLTKRPSLLVYADDSFIRGSIQLVEETFNPYSKKLRMVCQFASIRHLVQTAFRQPNDDMKANRLDFDFGLKVYDYAVEAGIL